MDMLEKLTEVLRAVEVGKCTVADARDAIIALFDEEQRTFHDEAVKWRTISEATSIRARVNFERAKAAEARCAKLVEALKRYGRHEATCDKASNISEYTPCTCGFAALAVKEEK